jgi:hypothetical protein
LRVSDAKARYAPGLFCLVLIHSVSSLPTNPTSLASTANEEVFAVEINYPQNENGH